jgi:hypothetical protein
MKAAIPILTGFQKPLKKKSAKNCQPEWFIKTCSDAQQLSEFFVIAPAAF